MDLDETLVYNIDEQDDVESTSQSTEKITRRRSAYLGDYVHE